MVTKKKAVDEAKTGNKRGIGYKSPPAGRPFKIGNPGGPGRPAGESLTTKLKRVLSEPDDAEGTKGDKLIKVAVKAANAGDFRFFKEIFERIDGKVPDRMANADGKDLLIRVLREPYKPAEPDGDD